MNNTAQQGSSEAQANAPLPLFRPEIWDTINTQWFGAIKLTQPVPAWIMATVAVVVTISLICFGVFGTYTKKIAVTGITMPRAGSLTISSLMGGVILRNHVSEGERVTKGQTLFELSNEQHVSNGALSSLLTQQLRIREQSLDAERRSRIAQDVEKRSELDARLLNLAAEEKQIEQEIELVKRRDALAMSTVKKYETLQANGFVSAAQVQQKVEESIDVSGRLTTLNRSLLQVRANQISLKGEREDLATNLAATLGQIDRSAASLRQEAAETDSRQRVLIKATQDGIVTTITNQPGQFVTAGQVLATLIPVTGNTAKEADEMEVHLYATSRTIGFTRVGQPVRIRYRAFPYEKFGLYDGYVTNVSKTPLPPNELPANIAETIVSQAFPGASRAESLYRIKVRPTQQSIKVYGNAQRITAGMTLEADLVLDKRRIWEWVLEPALAFAAR